MVHIKVGAVCHGAVPYSICGSGTVNTTKSKIYECTKWNPTPLQKKKKLEPPFIRDTTN